MIGASVLVLDESTRRDLVHFCNAIRSHQNRARRRAARLRRRIDQVVALHYGYLDLGGEG